MYVASYMLYSESDLKSLKSIANTQVDGQTGNYVIVITYIWA